MAEWFFFTLRWINGTSQKELERAKLEQESVTTEKKNLERQLLKQGGDQSELRTSYSDLEVSQLKAEIEVNYLVYN